MKFSYLWLRDFIPGLDVPARELEKLITVRTAECDGVERVGELLGNAHMARVIQTEPIEGSASVKAIVDIGAASPLTVVCGAPNCRAGLQTVWVPLPPKRLHGVESQGMLASPLELGLSRDHSGVVEWPDATLKLQPDDIFEIDNKSLTHRPDLWGHLGMAREVAAIVQKPLVDPVDLNLLPGGSDSFDVRIDDYELCPRFSAVAFENVVIRPSPPWLQYRLTSAGMNPINNVVDITNYVAAELAQPMHAFDRDKLQGDRLIVRWANDGETLQALNGENYTLDSSCGVVADTEVPVSLAGIIGGSPSAISDSSTRILFESANWKASAVRKTSAALKLRTDASMRFEKAQDPCNTVRALARAVALMRELVPEARLAGRLTDNYQHLPKRLTVRLTLDIVDHKLGRKVEPRETESILSRLEFGVTEVSPRVLEVTVPTWRATKDIAIVDDLVEEVGRMIGYDSIPPIAPLAACTVPPADPRRDWERDLRALLTARGFTEVYSYSFLSDADATRFHLNPADLLRVVNPIASDQNLMRSSLIPGIVTSVERNAKHFPAFRIFEIGREIHKGEGEKSDERPHLVAAVFTHETSGAGLFELKRIATSIAPSLKTETPGDPPAYAHPARFTSLGSAGNLFELHPSLLESGRAAILDLDLDAIFAERAPLRKYEPLRLYPSSSFDLSFAAPTREPSGRLESLIREFAGPLLESLAYITEYTGPQVPEGMKNISYRITVGASDRTLSASDISGVRDRVLAGMRERGFEIRT